MICIEVMCFIVRVLPIYPKSGMGRDGFRRSITEANRITRLEYLFLTYQ